MQKLPSVQVAAAHDEATTLSSRVNHVGGLQYVTHTACIASSSVVSTY
jgi:hypothetical protein